MRTKALALAGVAACALAIGLAGPALAAGSSSTSYQATLNPLNGVQGSGTVMLQLNGDQATVTEHVTGLAAKFGDAAYPHVQHIHINGQGQCPSPSADKNGDGIVDTVEGQPAYGGIGTTLSTSGDTSAKAATTLTVAPSGASFDYSRTFTLNADTMSALQAGTAVVVVHGLDPSTLTAKAQGEKSNLVPSLPLAATSPALCGALTVMQMNGVPAGSVNTGGGSMAATGINGTELALGGVALFAAGGMALLAYRRRTARN